MPGTPDYPWALAYETGYFEAMAANLSASDNNLPASDMLICSTKEKPLTTSQYMFYCLPSIVGLGRAAARSRGSRSSFRHPSLRQCRIIDG